MKKFYKDVSVWIIFSACILATGILNGCSLNKNSATEQIETNKIKENKEKFLLQDTMLIVLDDCEYITWTGSHREIGLTHKGNCKNPIHQYK